MTNIVERLRSTLSNEPSDDALWDRVIEERHDAALEIERLRAENERLREKLDEIAGYNISGPAGFEWDIVVEEIVEIAREALKAQPVAWRHKDAGYLSVNPLAGTLAEWEPLYTAPQLRKALEAKP